jgi:hypothetical protein
MKKAAATDSRIHIRVIVHDPLPGVAVAMQIGRDELQPPKTATKTRLIFETEAKVSRAPSGQLRLTGGAVQGTPDARFLYVNWGARAGQKDTHWDRRAKVMFGTIDERIVKACEAKGLALQAEIAGIGKDGGPCCATVPILGGWRVA